jgi:hypothetical protein
MGPVERRPGAPILAAMRRLQDEPVGVYEVRVRWTVSATVTVEASSYDEAREKAIESARAGGATPRCSAEYRIVGVIPPAQELAETIH